MKRLLSASLVILFLAVASFPQNIFSANCSQASKLFSSAYNVTFEVKGSGSVIVTQKVGLKNLSSDCFVSEFNLDVNTDKVKNISGTDSLGAIQIKLKKKPGTTSIGVKLNEEVIGLGKSTTFTLKYTLVDLAKKEGKIWNLDIPNIATGEKITSYRLKVIAPASFGDIFSISPSPKQKSKTKSSTILIFGKEILGKQKVSISFGSEQFMTFKIKVPLENKQIFPKKFKVPLPLDSATSRVLIKSMDPRPGKIYMDENGNYLAEYGLSAREFTEVKIGGVVKLVNERNKFVAVKTFTEKELEKFKQESRFIQVQNRLIQEKAKELGDARKIYEFVVDLLSFETVKVDNGDSERKGAVDALSENPSVTSLGFVDLFVALSRAAGIPAREVFGVAISDDQSLKPTFVGGNLNTNKLHIWAQIYDSEKNMWVDVDPTWGNVLGLDYFGKILPDRFALLYTTSSEGLELLKDLTTLSDNIEVSYSEKKEDFSPKLDFEIVVDQAVAGFPADLKIILENKKGVSIPNGRLFLEMKNLNLVGEETSQVDLLLPFEKKTLRFKLRGGEFFGKSEGLIKARFEAKTGGGDLSVSKEKSVQIASLFSFGLQQLLLLLALILIVIGIFAPKYFKKK
jgi:hypothetical protein